MRQLDEIDRQLLSLLAANARRSIAELSREVSLSAPATSERIRRLHERGVIAAFTIEIAPRATGKTIEAIVRVKPSTGQQQAVEQIISNDMRFTSCDRVTGDDCFIARVQVADTAELDEVLEALHRRAQTNTAIVKTSLFRGRLPL